mgnify:CR=1 FL=1
MDLATKMQEVLNDCYYDNCDDESRPKRVKATTAAFLSGAIDGAVIVYPLMLISFFAAGRKIKKLEKQ